ncbi:hypothetical protein ACS0TY_029124 [Phlomoides rotata]
MGKLAKDRCIPEKGKAADEEQSSEEEADDFINSRKRPRRAVSSSYEEQSSEEESDDYITFRKRPRRAVISMTLEDPDLLDCPICFEPLSSPVYQCKNGHIACASCCTTILKNKCSHCRLRIQDIRCMAIENILGSLIVACQFKPYGCTQTLRNNTKVAHEKACKFVPCSCPCIGCDFVGMPLPLYRHFALKHKDSSKQFSLNSVICISMSSTEKHVILQRERESNLFLLNRCIETLGNFYNVVCVAPPASEDRFLYELTATVGEDSIKVKTSVQKVSKWKQQPPAKMTLFVPSNLINTGQLPRLELIIKEKPVGRPGDVFSFPGE